MKKIKLILMLSIIMLMVIAFASCGEKSEEPDNTNITTEITNDVIVDPETGAYIEVGSGLKTMYLAKDVYGNVCTHVLLNTLTNEYWIYDFEYIYDWNTEGYVFNRAYLTIKDIEDKSINNNIPNTNPSTPSWTESNPTGTVLYHDDYIKITLQTIEEGLLGPSIKLFIENNGIKDVLITLDEVSVDGFVTDLTGLYAEVPIGKKSCESITIWNSELEDMGISDPQCLEFRFVISDADTWDDIAVSDLISINLNK